MNDLILAAAVGAAAGWLVPRALTKLFGTVYRTEKECRQCDTRRAVYDIRTMVQELAIKAGVPVSEALKVGADLGDGP
ncbi:hypothetical protein [Desulfobulbus elongatus]|uniref:hypothetical protein n=1 Tax=Desulfobulbus elongatus TaxID=53332 RepID=UPI0004812CBC|nr:hypothetical protein [Desulfobulbus elongatus]